jgi:hypothetical protein
VTGIAGRNGGAATRHVHRVRFAAITLLLLLAAAPALAQPGRRSPRATLTQMVGHTELSLRYYRPVARGRTIFPDVVGWGRVWTPGADSATRLELDGDIDVEGHRLAAGKYSLWVIPMEREDWTVIFSRAHTVFHLPYPDGQDALRITARPTTGPHMETLGFYFPLVDGDTAVLDLHWGTTLLPLRVKALPRGPSSGTAPAR